MDEIKSIKTNSKSSKMISFFWGLSSKTKELLDELKEEENITDLKRFVCIEYDGAIFNYNVFKSSIHFASNIYIDKILLEETKSSQHKMLKLLDDLKE